MCNMYHVYVYRWLLSCLFFSVCCRLNGTLLIFVDFEQCRDCWMLTSSVKRKSKAQTFLLLFLRSAGRPTGWQAGRRTGGQAGRQAARYGLYRFIRYEEEKHFSQIDHFSTSARPASQLRAVAMGMGRLFVGASSSVWSCTVIKVIEFQASLRCFGGALALFKVRQAVCQRKSRQNFVAWENLRLSAYRNLLQNLRFFLSLKLPF